MILGNKYYQVTLLPIDQRNTNLRTIVFVIPEQIWGQLWALKRSRPASSVSEWVFLSNIKSLVLLPSVQLSRNQWLKSVIKIIDETPIANQKAIAGPTVALNPN